MKAISGFITAGGRSSRMGRDKAWLELDGRPMISRVIDALKPVTANLNIIANAEEYRRLGLPVFADVNTDVGPLEAIRAALANSPTEWVMLVGCDMPFVTWELFKFLIRIAIEEDACQNDESTFASSDPRLLTPDARLNSADLKPMAVVPLDAKGRLEPLCALYARAALPAVTQLIESGERKVSELFERINTRRVRFAELEDLANAELFFENVNTPEDYEKAKKSLIFPS
ncbi:MAG: molybdenum cofactor guanylyltransferase [Acidobacteriota bacterium]